MAPTYEQKLAMLEENKDFAIFNELSSLNDSIKELIKAVESSKTEVVRVDNLSDAIVDLSPLQANFEALNGSVGAVTKAIQAIPKTKELDMSGIEKLLKQMAEKPEDMSHMVAMTKILDGILFAVQTTASHSGKKEEELAPDLKKIQEILNVLNENVVSIEIPGFDYDKLAEIIKKNVKINVSGGSGGNSYVRRVSDSAYINPATEEMQNSIVSAIQAIPGGGDPTPYDKLIDEVSTTITYIGLAAAGSLPSASVWRIYRINTTSGSAKRYADGVTTFTKKWDDRATYTYI